MGEYDDDGNVIVQGPRFNAKEVQNFDIRIQNVPLSSLPNKYLPDNISNIRTNTNSNNTSSAAQNVEPIPESGGYLDPETGSWVAEDKKESRSNSPDRRSYQESQPVPKLKINLGPKKPVEHAFFADLDRNARERDQRRNKSKHKKKKKKKKHY